MSKKIVVTYRCDSCGLDGECIASIATSFGTVAPEEMQCLLSQTSFVPKWKIKKEKEYVQTYSSKCT